MSAFDEWVVARGFMSRMTRNLNVGVRQLCVARFYV